MQFELSELAEEARRAFASLPKKQDPDTMSAGQFAAHLGIGHQAASNRLKRLMAHGLVKPELITIYDAWGMPNRVKGYRWVNGKAPIE